VGFGVSTEAQARQIVQFADGVIVGSQLVRLAGQAPPDRAPGRVAAFLAGLREAISAVQPTGRGGQSEGD
jgi:tryptophan synthase alpha chain